jgi:hypothetical protein
MIGIPFLTKKIEGRPQLQEHVPDKKTNKVYPKVDLVEKQVLAWVRKRQMLGKLDACYVQEWQELFAAKVCVACPFTCCLIQCWQPWAKKVSELPPERLPEWHDLPQRDSGALVDVAPPEAVSASDVRAAHTSQPYSGISVAMGAVEAPPPVPTRLTALGVTALKAWLQSQGELPSKLIHESAVALCRAARFRHQGGVAKKSCCAPRQAS